MPQWWIPGAPTPVINVPRCAHACPGSHLEPCTFCSIGTYHHMSCIMLDSPNLCNRNLQAL